MKHVTHHRIGQLVFISSFLILLHVSCQPQRAGEREQDAAANAVAEFVTPVAVMQVQTGTFTLEFISNGKLRAHRKSRIAYPFGEELVGIMVENGQAVQAGQGLARLCRQNLERRLMQTRIRFDRASIEMEDLLLGRGYSLKDSLRVPPEVWRIASINSGYSEALNELRVISEDLERTLIRAPFAGVVAGISVHAFERVNPGDVFCTLIDNTAFLVEFPIMEKELPQVMPGSAIEIQPFALPGRSYPGRVTAINPMVDERGQVQVTARVAGAAGLMDGMNVRVRVKRDVPGQLVVPRSAVLYRDDLEVLFKYEGGTAQWTYVNILYQNQTHFSVIANPDRVASLQPGDTVIVSGNMHLAHGSKVQIRD